MVRTWGLTTGTRWPWRGSASASPSDCESPTTVGRAVRERERRVLRVLVYHHITSRTERSDASPKVAARGVRYLRGPARGVREQFVGWLGERSVAGFLVQPGLLQPA